MSKDALEVDILQYPGNPNLAKHSTVRIDPHPDMVARVEGMLHELVYGFEERFGTMPKKLHLNRTLYSALVMRLRQLAYGSMQYPESFLGVELHVVPNQMQGAIATGGAMESFYFGQQASMDEWGNITYA